MEVRRKVDVDLENVYDLITREAHHRRSRRVMRIAEKMVCHWPDLPSRADHVACHPESVYALCASHAYCTSSPSTFQRQILESSITLADARRQLQENPYLSSMRDADRGDHLLYTLLMKIGHNKDYSQILISHGALHNTAHTQQDEWSSKSSELVHAKAIIQHRENTFDNIFPFIGIDAKRIPSSAEADAFFRALLDESFRIESHENVFILLRFAPHIFRVTDTETYDRMVDKPYKQYVLQRMRRLVGPPEPAEQAESLDVRIARERAYYNEDEWARGENMDRMVEFSMYPVFFIEDYMRISMILNNVATIQTLCATIIDPHILANNIMSMSTRRNFKMTYIESTAICARSFNSKNEFLCMLLNRLILEEARLSWNLRDVQVPPLLTHILVSHQPCPVVLVTFFLEKIPVLYLKAVFHCVLSGMKHVHDMHFVIQYLSFVWPHKDAVLPMLIEACYWIDPMSWAHIPSALFSFSASKPYARIKESDLVPIHAVNANVITLFQSMRLFGYRLRDDLFNEDDYYTCFTDDLHNLHSMRAVSGRMEAAKQERHIFPTSVSRCFRVRSESSLCSVVVNGPGRMTCVTPYRALELEKHTAGRSGTCMFMDLMSSPLIVSASPIERVQTYPIRAVRWTREQCILFSFNVQTICHDSVCQRMGIRIEEKDTLYNHRRSHDEMQQLVLSNDSAIGPPSSIKYPVSISLLAPFCQLLRDMFILDKSRLIVDAVHAAADHAPINMHFAEMIAAFLNDMYRGSQTHHTWKKTTFSSSIMGFIVREVVRLVVVLPHMADAHFWDTYITFLRRGPHADENIQASLEHVRFHFQVFPDWKTRQKMAVFHAHVAPPPIVPIHRLPITRYTMCEALLFGGTVEPFEDEPDDVSDAGLHRLWSRYMAETHFHTSPSSIERIQDRIQRLLAPHSASFQTDELNFIQEYPNVIRGLRILTNKSHASFQPLNLWKYVRTCGTLENAKECMQRCAAHVQEAYRLCVKNILEPIHLTDDDLIDHILASYEYNTFDIRSAFSYASDEARFTRQFAELSRTNPTPITPSLIWQCVLQWIATRSKERFTPLIESAHTYVHIPSVADVETNFLDIKAIITKWKAVLGDHHQLPRAHAAAGSMRRTPEDDSDVATKRARVHPIEEFDCAVCFERISHPRIYTCTHNICLYCVEQHLKTIKLNVIDESMWILPPHTCAATGCDAHMQMSVVRTILDEQRATASAADYLPVLESIHTLVQTARRCRMLRISRCRGSDCATYHVSATVQPDLLCSFECESCATIQCSRCFQEPHDGVSCEMMQQMRSANVHPLGSDIPFTSSSMKHCPRCNALTEREGGCVHIRCTSCAYEWCWECRGKSHSHGEVCEIAKAAPSIDRIQHRLDDLRRRWNEWKSQKIVEEPYMRHSYLMSAGYQVLQLLWSWNALIQVYPHRARKGNMIAIETMYKSLEVMMDSMVGPQTPVPFIREQMRAIERVKPDLECRHMEHAGETNYHLQSSIASFTAPIHQSLYLFRQRSDVVVFARFSPAIQMCYVFSEYMPSELAAYKTVLDGGYVAYMEVRERQRTIPWSFDKDRRLRQKKPIRDAVELVLNIYRAFDALYYFCKGSSTTCISNANRMIEGELPGMDVRLLRAISMRWVRECPVPALQIPSGLPLASFWSQAQSRKELGLSSAYEYPDTEFDGAGIVTPIERDVDDV